MRQTMTVPSQHHPTNVISPRHNHETMVHEPQPVRERIDSSAFAERESLERVWSQADAGVTSSAGAPLDPEEPRDESPKIDTEAENKPLRKRWLLWLIILVGITGGVAAGIGIGVSSKSSSKGSTSPGTSPTIVITLPPTPVPTTPAPTIRCPPIEGPLVVNGVPVEETMSEEPFACGDPSHTHSRWFNVTGGDEVLVADLDIIDLSGTTTVTVIEASCGENVSCDLAPASFDRVTWFGRKGQDYFVVVSGTQPLTFELTVGYEDVSACELAAEIPNDGTVVPGSIRSAGFDEFIFSCEFSRASAQLYYYFTGTGNPMLVSTCHNLTNFAARMNILNFENCRNCAAPTSSRCGPHGFSTIFQSEAGRQYKAFVFKSANEADIGSFFEISVEDAQIESNDQCNTAIPLSTGSSSKGSTRLATTDDVSACGPIEHPGVWYVVRGTGRPMQASTCNDETNYASSVTVYRGSCESLECVETGTQSCGIKGSVYFDSIDGEIYYFLVHGESTSADPVVGEYRLEIADFVPAENDECINAISLDASGDEIIGSTFDATPDDVQACDSIGSDASGVWYKIVPSVSRPLRASTCSGMTNYDTQITVYRGSSCNNLICVNTNDNSCGFQSSVAWSAIAGTQYYILVHGRSQSSTGDFTLSVEPYEPEIENDFCDAALTLPIDGSVEVSSTLTATFDNAITCGPENTGPGIWYTIEGTGTELEASLCNPQTNFDTAISIYTGDCVDLVCVTGNTNGEACGTSSKVKWVSELRQYFILVHGFRERAGAFGLSLSEVPPVVANDFCVGAQEVSLSPDSIEGTLEGATRDIAPDCVGILSNGPGVWYRVTATENGRLEAKTCDSENTDLNTKITVYRGGCGALECVRADEDGCGFGSLSRVTWDAVTGEEYHIHVQVGPSESVGSFDLKVQKFESLQGNDLCSEAVLIRSDGTLVSGSTIGTSFDNQETCGTDNTAPGAWYVVLGTGERFVADTCSDFTYFDTKITVFRGSCEEPICVDGNDDGCGFSSAVAWNTQQFEPYYILVHGFATQVGNFGLRVNGVLV